MIPAKPCWLLCLFCGVLAPAAASPSWDVQVWQAGTGVLNTNVLGVAQTPDGHLWVALPRSLTRFDGFEFEEFPLAGLGAELGPRARLTLWDGKGGLWLILPEGRVALLSATGVERIVDGLPAELTSWLATVDGEGALWIAYRGGTFCRVSGSTVKTFPTGDDAYGVENVPAIATDVHGHVWWSQVNLLGNSLGVYRNERFEVKCQLPQLATRLAAASGGGVWIGVRGKLLKYDEENGLVDLGYVTSEKLDTRVTVLLESRTGGLWIGTSTGLFFYDDGKFKAVPASSSIVLALTEDDEGNLWVGSENGSINRVQRRAIEVEGFETGLPFAAVHSLSEDTRGQLWAVTHSGLPVRRVDGRWEVFADSRLSRGNKTCTAADADGGVWFGSAFYGLNRLKNGEVDTWTLEGHTVRSLLAASSGDIWIGMEGPETVQRLRAGKLQTMELPPGTFHLRTMAEDMNGDVWMAGTRGILLRAHGDKLIDETARIGGESQTISCLYPAKDGALWIGYIGGGLARLKEGQFSRVNTEHGLYDEVIAQMVADETGTVWLGSQRGLFKVSEDELNAVADGRAVRLRSVSYAGRVRLPSLQTNFAYSYGALRSRAGRLYVPLGTALAIIDPKQVSDNLEPPTVLLKKVLIDGRVAGYFGALGPVRDAVDLRLPGGKLVVAPAHRRLEFDFTALSLSGQENVKFRYRLEGFDDHWVEAGALRSAMYSRLSEGNYRFRVAACNRDGIWNETGASIAFQVAPFVWQRWWFQSGALLLFTSVIVLVVRYVSFRRLRLKLRRAQQEAALGKERARIARDIHDDLGGWLTKILLLTGLAQRERGDPEQSQQRVMEISATARRVIKSLDETVWAINPRNDTLPDLINYIGQYAAELLHAAELRYQLELPSHPPHRSVSAEARHNLFLVVKEALSNIVKHAGPCDVRLRVELADDGLHLTIADTGRGFAQLAHGPGADGLLNMRQRMEEIGGRYEMTSEPGKGATVRLFYPWQAEPML